MRKIVMIAMKMGIIVGDSIRGIVSVPIGVLIASVVDDVVVVSFEENLVPSSSVSMYVLFCVDSTLVVFAVTGGLLVGKKKPLPPPRLIGGREPISGSFGKAFFDGTKLSFLVFPLIPVIDTRTWFFTL